MKRITRTTVLLCCFVLTTLLGAAAAAQNLQQDLTALVETPGVTGYERPLADELRTRLKQFSPRSDNLGNVSVTLGSGSPHRLIVAPMDEPGYVVSGITDDGFLRLQRLPQQAPHVMFDLLHAAQPVVIQGRSGRWISGVIAGLSTHLQPNRQNAPRGMHPDEMYVDIGAATAAEVRQAGVDLLDPVALDRKLYQMGSGRMAGASVGDRFGCAALLELLRRMDPAKLRGRLTIAFVAEQWASARGLDRLLQHVAVGNPVDEMVYVGRLLPRRAMPRTAASRAAELPAQPRQPMATPGSGISIGTENPEGALAGLALELKQLGDRNSIPIAADFSALLPRVTYTQGPVLPQRFAHFGIPTQWPATPAEIVDTGDIENLVGILEAYAQGTAKPRQPIDEAKQEHRAGRPRPQSAPSVTQVLEGLVETYGVSGHEGVVRETIARLLPPWAKTETDAAGNLLLRVASPTRGVQAPRIAFIAHMDEIGYVVRSITPDGVLEVQSRGGGIGEFFAGHPVLVHTATGPRPGVLELPRDWDKPGFEWRPPQPGEVTTWRVDVGARNAGEVERLGIQMGDSITVPKKYRRLLGTRVSARSFDDRVGCAALVAAVWALGSNLPGRDVTFVWSTEEEVGLHGALAAAQRFAREGQSPDYVFAVDTFVSSDSPLESKRFADAPIGKGFVIRAVDNSNITPRGLVDRLAKIARADSIPVQYGVTGGGNDGAAFLRYGSVDVPIAWPLRYAHSPGEVIDTRDVEALARIVAAIARNW